MQPGSPPSTKSCWKRILNGIHQILLKLILYFGFYGSLGLLLTGMYYSFLTHTGGESHETVETESFIIKSRPGMRFFPLPPGDHYNSFTIWYNRSNPDHTSLYTSHLLGIINQEFDSKNLKEVEYVPCKHDVSYNGGALMATLTSERELCSAYDHRNLDWGECTPNGTLIKNDSGPFKLGQFAFGFTKGRPCIMVRLNKINLWEPSNAGLTKEKISEYRKVGVDIPVWWLKKTKEFPLHESYIWIYCGGVTEEDQQLMGDLSYFPKSRPAIPKIYFPSRSQSEYVAPFIFIQFLNPAPHAIIRIQCMAFDNNFNIQQHFYSAIGTINFELLID